MTGQSVSFIDTRRPDALHSHECRAEESAPLDAHASGQHAPGS
jgi:hypothetical protein